MSDDLTHIKGEDYFCYLGWVHLGMLSPLDKGIHSLIDNLAATGEKEMVLGADALSLAV